MSDFVNITRNNNDIISNYSANPDSEGDVGDGGFAAQLAENTNHILWNAINLKIPFHGLTPATGDGLTDDTAAIQAIINYAQDNNLPIYIPGNIFKTTGTLNITKRIVILGSGMGVSKIRYSGASSAIKVQPPTDGSSNTFYDFRDFGVEPVTVGQGTYGFEFVLGTNAYISNWEMHRVYVGDFGNYGISLNNDVGNANGFFSATIRRCWITNGIKGTNIGDSISVSENTITGKNTGINFTHLSGARQVVIRENNITTVGGAISLSNADQPSILNNQLEHPVYLGNYTGTNGGFIYLNNVTAPEIRGNTVSPAGANVSITSAAYAILIDGTSSLAIITCNTISIGETYHIGFTAASANNTVASDNNYDTTPVINNLTTGTTNRGIDIPLTPQNSWVTYEAGSDISARKLESGLIIVRGALKSGTVTTNTILATLPAGMRPNRKKRFQVTNFNGTTFSSATLLLDTGGNISILSASVANNLLHLDGIVFTAD